MVSIETCNGCGLAAYRRSIVRGRGVIPADILFIGEAPGKTEDLLSKAFIGPSGKLLDSIIANAARLARLDAPDFYITNTVLCRPTDSKRGPNREPTRDEVAACNPNVIRIYNEVNPSEVVLIGKIAERHYMRVFRRAARIVHPAFLLRRGGETCPEFLTAVRLLSQVFIRIGGKHGEEAISRV